MSCAHVSVKARAENRPPAGCQWAEPHDRAEPMAKSDKSKRHDVYTLMVLVGRAPEDDLPDWATGAELLCYATGVDEAEAVRETVAVLRQAGLSPLDVSGYGSLDERLAEGHDIDDEEREMMGRAAEENSVIVAQMTPVRDAPDGDG